MPCRPSSGRTPTASCSPTWMRSAPTRRGSSPHGRTSFPHHACDDRPDARDRRADLGGPKRRPRWQSASVTRRCLNVAFADPDVLAPAAPTTPVRSTNEWSKKRVATTPLCESTFGSDASASFPGIDAARRPVRRPTSRCAARRSLRHLRSTRSLSTCATLVGARRRDGRALRRNAGCGACPCGARSGGK